MARSDTCPACTGHVQDPSTERPPHWLLPRPFCVAHKRTALLPTGERLEAALDAASREAGFPVEGSGLSYVLNPVSIGGKWIGWVDFAASGSAVYETVFSSTTWAEFLAQHTRDGVELLYTLDALTLTGPQAVEPPATHVLASRMLWNWQFEIAVRQQLHARGIQVARSLVEAVAILGDADRVLEIARDMADINAGRVTAKELPKKIATDAQLAAASALPDPLGPEGGEECMRWLQALARRRFAHIAKAGG